MRVWVGSILTAPLAAEAQQSGKGQIQRIGVLWMGMPPRRMTARDDDFLGTNTLIHREAAVVVRLDIGPALPLARSQWH